MNMAWLLLLLLHFVASQDNVYWEHVGNDVGGTKYSSLTDINKSNVGFLTEAWTFRWGENPIGPNVKYPTQSTPLMVEDGTAQGRSLLIFCLGWRSIVALDAQTGDEVWRNNDGADTVKAQGQCRGVETWVDTQKAPGELCRRVIYMPTGDRRLLAVDAATGVRCPDFGDNGFLNLSIPRENCDRENFFCVWYYNPPTVVNNVLAIGSGISDNLMKNAPKGSIPGFDARTGRELWRFSIIPTDPNDPAMVTWPNGTEEVGAGNAWALLSGDEELGLIFVPTSCATGEHQGIHRPGDNYHTSGVLALNASTGEKVWFQQLVHHDIWDFDMNTQPLVGTITKDGQKRKVVVQSTKMGFVFVFDAATGEPVYQIEERSVKQSNVPGELTSPTQPFPVDDFLRLATTSIDMRDGGADLWGYSEADLKFCRETMLNNVTRQADIYDPPEVGVGTIWIPGTHGGTHHSGVSLYPDRNILLVPTNHQPAITQLLPIGTSESELPKWCNQFFKCDGLPYWDCNNMNILDQGLRPCFKPTWTRLTAIDLENGAILWDRPLGFLPPLPETYGSRWYLGGILMTASGIAFVGNTEDKYLRAYDIDNGNVIWQTPDPFTAQPCGTPITYRVGGRQYIALMVGGCEAPFTTQYRDDLFVVYALP